MHKGGSAIAVPMSGIFPDAAGGRGTFAGTLMIRGVVRDNEQIFAVGTLTGTLVDSLGQPVTGTVRQLVTLPLSLAAAHGTAELGPVQVEVLGRRVDLSRVVLGIDEPEPGQSPAAG